MQSLAIFPGELLPFCGWPGGRSASIVITRIVIRRAKGVTFEIVGEIGDMETFASGRGLRELARLNRIYGRGRWRIRKGIATVRLPDGTELPAELHWYEATGIGRKEYKIKRYLD